MILHSVCVCIIIIYSVSSDMSGVNRQSGSEVSSLPPRSLQRDTYHHDIIYTISD